MVGTIISHYKIIEKVGSGALGEVYKAQDTKLQRTVALKFLPSDLTRDEETRKRLVNEARAASALDHPNIGAVYEIDEADGRLFMAMAYYEGESLKEKIKDQRLEIQDALELTLQITKGIAAAHSKGIIHRDVKPANIVITGDGQLKIIDFGLARLKDQTVITRDGSSTGTAAYMSPEQAQGAAADQRGDVWSVGVILYEMLAGAKPFSGQNEQAVIHNIINEEPEFITKIRSDVPIQIEKIINRALAKNPDKRYQTMDEMLNDLDAVLAQIKEGDSKTASFLKLSRKQRRLAYRVLAIVLLLAMAAIYLWQNVQVKSEPVSIALLPLQSITNDANQEWLTESMTDALITDLAKISGLRVISHASAMQFKRTDKTTPQIAAALGVQYLIKGSIAKSGEKIKIAAKLIHALHEEELWSNEYDRQFIDILKLQGEIAQSIASQVQVKLTHQEATRLAVTRQVNPGTYELYLKGMYHINKYTPDGFMKGLDYLHKAVESDPKEPLAYAGLALAYGLIAHSPSPQPGAGQKSKEAAIKALELDESLAVAHLALAMSRIYDDWDKEGAEKSYIRCLEINPNLAVGLNQYTWYLLLIGKNKEAEEALIKAEKLDPLVPAYPAWLSSLYSWLGRYDEAIAEAKKSLELVDNFPIALWILGDVYANQGRFEEAIEVHKTLSAISIEFKGSLARTYALAGEKDKALAITAEMESNPAVWDTWGLAEIYTALGDKDKAFYWLEQAFRQRHPYIQWLKRNPSFYSLSDDPRFKDLAKRLKI